MKLLNFFSTIGVVLFISYIVYTLGSSVRSNYLIQQKIGQLDEEIAVLKLKNQRGKNLLVYYQTNSFKELEIRRQLNWKKEGEKVFLTDSKDKVGESFISSPNQHNIPINQPPSVPNYQKWRQFIIG